MKKIVYALFAIACGIFTSCMDSEEIEILKDVTVTIQPSSVVSSFAGFQTGDLDMYSDKNGTSKLRISAFLYDEEGKLVVEKSTLLKDYSSDYTFTLNALDLKKKYQILVVSNAIQGTLENPIRQSYSLSNTSDINKLTVFQEYHNSFYSNWSVLGLGRQEIIPNENTNYLIKLHPGSAMFIHYWNDIHAFDNVNVDKYLFDFHNNDQVSYNGNWDYSTTLANNIYKFIYIDVTQNAGSNIYMIFNILPNSSMHYFGRLYIGEESLDFKEMSPKGEGSIEVVAGCTYEINYDCSNLSIDISKKSSGSSIHHRDYNKSCNINKIGESKRSEKVLNLLN